MNLGDFQLGPLNCRIGGGIVGLVGPNGAGKTTLLSIAGGVYSRHEGSVFLGNCEEPASALERRQMVSTAGLSDHWYDDLTLAQHLPLYTSTCQSWDVALWQEWVRRLGVSEHKKMKALSAGSRTKAALAIAIARRAPVIALDEPWNTLDPLGRRELTRFIVDIASCMEHPPTILVSSHELERLENVAERLMFISRGKVVFDGTWHGAREMAGLSQSASSTDVYERMISFE